MNSPAHKVEKATQKQSQASLALALPVDTELIAQLGHRDETIARKAFSALYNAYCHQLYEYAYYLTRNEASAEEVVAEVFARLWHRRQQWNPETKIAPYLFGAVRLQVWEEQRRMRRRALLTEYFVPSGESPGMSMAAPAPDKALEIADTVEPLRDALGALSGRARAAVMYRWYEGLEFSEIAERLGTTEGAIRVTISRALKALRAALRNR
jgi:RNA polymerase sigma-70 factor (ECF subfamily)